jgi:carbonic anhydrase
LVTQTEPGELFIIRNAGNLVPPYGAANGGEGATIEFAVVGLGIQHIIVCGHSHCWPAVRCKSTARPPVWQ